MPEYNIGFLLDFIDTGNKPIGNADLFRRSLYERHFYRLISGGKLTTNESCYSGTLYLDSERIDDVRTRCIKTYRDYLKDYCELDIHNAFGLSITEYLNHTPKDILILNEIALKRLKDQAREISQQLINGKV